MNDCTLYRRKPIFVRATRVTDKGNLADASCAWIERQIAERRLVRGETQWFIQPGDLHVAAVYPSQWIVLVEDNDLLFVMDDDSFQTTYERVEIEENT